MRIYIAIFSLSIGYLVASSLCGYLTEEGPHKSEKCYNLSFLATNQHEATDLRAAIWLEKDVARQHLLRIAFLRESGDFHAFVTKLEIERQDDDGSWNTLLDLKKTSFSQEVLSVPIDQRLHDELQRSFQDGGYPRTQPSSNLRLTVGRLFFK